jgi:poly-gamma-glutamate synthase PgsB/CapB
MIAAILREEGKRVLAKTTGTKASYILPNGEEIEVYRRGVVSIIEQKKLVKKAFQLNVDCLVAEIMSIHPENHFVETQKLLKPHIIVITNVRRDHTDAMGKTPAEIAAVFTLDITERSTLFILEEENNDIFVNAVKKAGGELISVKKGLPGSIDPEMENHFFSNNISLVNDLCKHLAIGQKTIINGLRKATYDNGEFKVWRCRPAETKKSYYLANAFAANDPESTFHIIIELNKKLPLSRGNLIGLLNLRADRGDRTLQWIEALRNGGSDHFKYIYVIGTHARVVGKKLKNTIILPHKEPEKIMAAIYGNGKDEGSVIFGFGNIKGAGKLLVNHWKKTGEEYGL